MEALKRAVRPLIGSKDELLRAMGSLYNAGTSLATGNVFDAVSHVAAAGGEAARVKDKRRMLAELVNEVNAALSFIVKVKQWLKRAPQICAPERASIAGIVREVEAMIKTNFISTSSFLQKLKSADAKIAKAIDAIHDGKKTPGVTEEVYDMWLSADPAYYRLELSAAMLRLVEKVKESVMDILMSGSSCNIVEAKPVVAYTPPKGRVTAKDLRQLRSRSSSRRRPVPSRRPRSRSRSTSRSASSTSASSSTSRSRS